MQVLFLSTGRLFTTQGVIFSPFYCNTYHSFLSEQWKKKFKKTTPPAAAPPKKNGFPYLLHFQSGEYNCNPNYFICCSYNLSWRCNDWC